MKIIFILMFMAAGTAARSEDKAAALKDLYTYRGVSVNASGPSAEIARQEAMDQAYLKAFKAVISRLVAHDDVNRLPTLKPAELETMVSEVVVDSEKSSRRNYVATLDVSFNPELVNRYLDEREVPHIAMPAPASLLIPFFSRQRQEYLWENTNPWLRFWLNSPPASAATPVVVPDPALEDGALRLTKAEAASRDRKAIMAWAHSQGYDSAVYTEANQSSKSLHVQVFRVDDDSFRKIGDFEHPLAGNYMSDAAERVVGILRNDWRANNELEESNEHSVEVLINFASPKDWVRLKSRLDNLRVITSYNLRALRNTKAQVTLWTSASVPQVMQALQRAHFDVVELENGVLRLDYMD